MGFLVCKGFISLFWNFVWSSLAENYHFFNFMESSPGKYLSKEALSQDPKSSGSAGRIQVTQDFQTTHCNPRSQNPGSQAELWGVHRIPATVLGSQAQPRVQRFQGISACLVHGSKPLHAKVPWSQQRKKKDRLIFCYSITGPMYFWEVSWVYPIIVF